MYVKHPMYKYVSMLLVALALLPHMGMAQRSPSPAKLLGVKDKKAAERYHQALAQYDRYNLEIAEDLLLEAVQREPSFAQAYLMLAQVYEERGLPLKAIAAAERADSLRPELYPQLPFFLGQLHQSVGHYHEAKLCYERFLTFHQKHPQSPKLIEPARNRLSSCQFALDALEHPVPFSPQNVGAGVNSVFDEYWPSLSADEQTLVYTVRCPKQRDVGIPQSRWQEDFFISHREADGGWGMGRPMGPPINTDYNEGAQSLSADGRQMFFTVCRGICNIYYTEVNRDGYWEHPRRMPTTVNTDRYNEKQPSISPDGRTLYFVSNRPGGKGGYDVWSSTRDSAGQWQPAVNLGDTINTNGDEQSPFIHFDNQTLYFSSDGHTGMGRQDIFVSRRDTAGRWGIPRNVGYPINTHRSEEGLIVNAAGTVAYYSSDIAAERGRDIYTFTMPAEVAPIPTSYFMGAVRDGRTRRPIEAEVVLVDLGSKRELMRLRADEAGSFLVCLPVNRQYGLFASAQGYLFHSEHVNFEGSYPRSRPFRVDVMLHPIAKDEVLVMRNIFFATASYELRPESTVELDRLVLIMQQNPDVRIEIGGHTDDEGSIAYNQRLSEQRARAVVDYLVQRGIEVSRLRSVGYGASRPVAPNSTPEGRAQNRRTEAKVL